LEDSLEQVFSECSFNCEKQLSLTKLFQVLNEKKDMEPKVATRARYVVKEITVLEVHLSHTSSKIKATLYLFFLFCSSNTSSMLSSERGRTTCLVK